MLTAPLTTKTAFLLLLVLVAAQFHDVLFCGHVISPHDNAAEVGAVSEDQHLSYPRFSDHCHAYIPEIHLHANGNGRGWLNTWNPHVQLGRPAGQLCGFSKAYPLTRCIMLFTHDAWKIYTALTVVTVLLTAVFCFAFLRSLDVLPAACLCAATGLALGVFASCWLTFVMFLSPLCWSAALLWLVNVFLQRRSVAAWFGISFACYSLLMTGYPQSVVTHAYLVSAFTLVRWLTINASWRERVKTILLLGTAAASGLLAASPVYLDLALNTGRSARLQVGDDYFLAVLPQFRQWADVLLFLGRLYDSFWFGNPLLPTYPPPEGFGGASFTPLFCVLICLSPLVGGGRRLWLWQAFVLFGIVAMLVPAVYLFAVHHLGFHLSRGAPLGCAFLPGYVLAGLVLDRVFRQPVRRRVLASLVALGPFLVSLLAMWLSHAWGSHGGYVTLSALLAVGMVAFLWSRSERLAVAMSIVTVFAFGYPLVLSRPASQIHCSSELVETIASQTRDGTRFARFGRTGRLLPPNEECLVGLRSIHSYDSLSSRQYQGLAGRISVTGATVYGRHFGHLDSERRLTQPDLSLCGIGLLIANQPIRAEGLRSRGRVAGLELYQPAVRPILLAQLTACPRTADGRVALTAALPEVPHREVQRLQQRDDWMRLQLIPASTETILFVSQQFHPQWHARSPQGQLATLPINDFFLGVQVPPGVAEVELEFRPMVRWAWLGQLFYAVGGIVCVVGNAARFWTQNMRQQDPRQGLPTAH
jgi:hypothetical protein